jgi:DNA-binding NarL/FixJ family response regulator
MIRIAIVHPDREARSILRRLLSSEPDFQVVGEAANGKEAIDLCASQQPDLILTEINMPIMDGITATEYIVDNFKKTHVIILSFQNEPDYIRRGMLAGARDYLPVPSDPIEIIDTIYKVATGKSPPRPMARKGKPKDTRGVPGDWREWRKIIQESTAESIFEEKKSPLWKPPWMDQNHDDFPQYPTVKEPIYAEPTELSRKKEATPRKLEEKGSIQEAPPKTLFLISGNNQILRNPESKAIYHFIRDNLSKYFVNPFCVMFFYPFQTPLYLMANRSVTHEYFLRILESNGFFCTAVSKVKVIPTAFMAFADEDTSWLKNFKWKSTAPGPYDEQFKMLLNSFEPQILDRENDKAPNKEPKPRQKGYVYLLKVGRYYKIGKADIMDRRVKQLRLVLPEEAVVIHAIETGDPLGIEAYWHRRYKEYRKRGEFFNLPESEVDEFKLHKEQ